MFVNGSLYILFPILTILFMFLLPYLILSGIIWIIFGFHFNKILLLYEFVIKILQLEILKDLYFITPFSITGFILFIFVLKVCDFNYRIPLIFIYFFVFLYINFFPYMFIFDTGHGQSIFINTPSNSFLLDAGNSHFYIEDSIINFLNFFSLNIDHAIISHDDFDHYSGIIKLYKKGYVKKIFAGKTSSLSNNKIPFKAIDNIKIYTFPGIELEGKRLKDIGTDNQRSLFFSLDFLNKRTLIFSDLEAQEIFPNLSKDNSVANVVVGHHGSSESLSKELISLWNKPSFFISCNKKFNNPQPDTLAILKNNKVYSTREKGAIFVDLTTGIKFFAGK